MDGTLTIETKFIEMVKGFDRYLNSVAKPNVFDTKVSSRLFIFSKITFRGDFTLNDKSLFYEMNAICNEKISGRSITNSRKASCIIILTTRCTLFTPTWWCVLHHTVPMAKFIEVISPEHCLESQLSQIEYIFQRRKCDVNYLAILADCSKGEAEKSFYEIIFHLPKQF